jgi:hypothetical protein
MRTAIKAQRLFKPVVACLMEKKLDLSAYFPGRGAQSETDIQIGSWR